MRKFKEALWIALGAVLATLVHGQLTSADAPPPDPADIEMDSATAATAPQPTTAVAPQSQTLVAPAPVCPLAATVVAAAPSIEAAPVERVAVVAPAKEEITIDRYRRIWMSVPIDPTPVCAWAIELWKSGTDESIEVLTRAATCVRAARAEVHAKTAPGERSYKAPAAAPAAPLSATTLTAGNAAGFTPNALDAGDPFRIVIP